jgi:hypothetical protein
MFLPDLPFTLPLIPQIILLGMTIVTFVAALSPRLCQNVIIRYLAKLTACVACFWLFHYYLQLYHFD